MIQPQTDAQPLHQAPSIDNPFAQLGLIEAIHRAVSAEGYTEPTPIQKQAIPKILDGRDVIGCAQTGTGKTAAFVLPLLQVLADRKSPNGPALKSAFSPRALVLTPTRELAAQICTAIKTYGRHMPLSHGVIYGGVSQVPQVSMLRRGVDILVATPGRLRDLRQQGYLRFERVEHVVLDEADRMLDQGFLPEVRRIFSELPRQRQTLLFSATMPSEIRELAQRELREPITVTVTPVSSTPEAVSQSVYFVDQNDKRDLLLHLLQDTAITRAIVFTRTKHGADRVVRQLIMDNESAEAIHGNKSQGAREKALASFRDGRVRVLVATDLAARGIDVEEISHVINFDLPQDSEGYVHRIGRTARAGTRGIALTFCSNDERAKLRAIERLTSQNVPEIADHPFRLAPEVRNQARPQQQQSGQASHRQGQGYGQGQRQGGGTQAAAFRGPQQRKPSSWKQHNNSSRRSG